MSRELGEFIDVVPPQQRIDEHWYQGTADAVYQNIYTIEKERPDYVVILAGDHIYKMNYRTMVDFHLERRSRPDGRRTAGVGRRGPAFWRDAGRQRSQRSRFRGEETRIPKRFPAIRTAAWPRWAFTCSTRDSCSSSCASMPRSPAASTISAATSFPR